MTPFQPPTNHGSTDFVDLLISFFLGVASSATITYVYHLLTRKSRKQNQELLAAQLSMIWIATQVPEDSDLPEQMAKDLSLAISPDLDRSEARAEYSQLMHESLTKLSTDLDQGERVKTALRYQAIARAWSDSILQEDLPTALDQTGRVTRSRLTDLHKAIFPPEYAGRGVIRTIPVWITSVYQARGSITTPRSGVGRTETTPPNEIDHELDILIRSWNSAVDALGHSSAESQYRRIAEFHHDLQRIHPFLDGNGRLGRAVMDQQARFLLGRGVGDRLGRIAYLESLQVADRGNLEPFIAELRRAIEAAN